MRPVLAAAVAALSLAAGCAGEERQEDVAGVRSPTLTQPLTAYESVPDLIEAVQPSVVAVQVRGARGAGEGSGVILDDGVVVTNNHVVDRARRVVVLLASGDRIDADVRATDPLSDLAVLETGRDDLPAATLAEELPRVGELAIALGNPLGFEQTATQGIVSGLHRNLPGGGGGALVDLIQTDAAISPGNSGGALVDSQGRVIGINVAYIPPQARAVAIGFAIPAPTVREVVDELLEDGTAEHAFLGVRPASVTPAIAEQLGIDGGTLVLAVTDGSPAAAAGLRRGDVITSVDGRKVDSVEALLAALRDREPGDRVRVGYVRDGDERTARVTLASRE